MMADDTVRPFLKISAAGFAATAIAYGPARMGFGLFLPEFREDFALSTRAAGIVSSLGFSGFLLGLWAAYMLLARLGPRVPVIAGLVAASSGFALVATAGDVPALTLGVVLAMSSAGFAWAPFNNAVQHEVRYEARPLALSLISTGTSVGVAAAGAVALALHATALGWRVGWAAFAVLAAAAVLGNVLALRRAAQRPATAPRRQWRALLRRSALPIYAVALSYGTVSSVYISFAADTLRQAGGLPGLAPAASPAVLFLAYGLIGLAGLGTDRMRTALGLAGLVRALQLTAIASLALIAVAPTAWTTLVLSAGLQGAHVMVTSATLSFWTERRFLHMPALGFTAALLGVAAGSALGPALAGLVAEAHGARVMFLATALLPLATLVGLWRHTVDEQAIPA